MSAADEFEWIRRLAEGGIGHGGAQREARVILPEVDRLRALVAELEAERDALQVTLEETREVLGCQITELKAERDRLHDRIDEYAAEDCIRAVTPVVSSAERELIDAALGLHREWIEGDGYDALGPLMDALLSIGDRVLAERAEAAPERSEG